MSETESENQAPHEGARKHVGWVTKAREAAVALASAGDNVSLADVLHVMDDSCDDRCEPRWRTPEVIFKGACWQRVGDTVPGDSPLFQYLPDQPEAVPDETTGEDAGEAVVESSAGGAETEKSDSEAATGDAKKEDSKPESKASAKKSGSKKSSKK